MGPLFNGYESHALHIELKKEPESIIEQKTSQTSSNSMITNLIPMSTFTSLRWRRVFFCSLCFVAAGIAAVGAVGS